MSERRINGASRRLDSIDDGSSKLPVPSSGQNRDDISLECKAAYLSVVKSASTDKPLTSKSELLLALQNTGRNPTNKSLSRYWTSTTERVGFDEFCTICLKEPVTTADDLMKAFKKIDINGDGFISHSELKKVMTTKGEKMTDEEVSKLIDEVDENKDGKLDYNEFSNMVLTTSKQCKEKAIARFEKKTSTQPENHFGSNKKSSLNGVLEGGNKHRDDEGNKNRHRDDDNSKNRHRDDENSKNRHRDDENSKNRHRDDENSKNKHRDDVADKNRHRDAEGNKNRHRDLVKGSAHEEGSSKLSQHEEAGKSRHRDEAESRYSHRDRHDSTSSAKGRKSSTPDGTEAKRGVVRSPRLSPRVSPRTAKGTRSKEEPQKEKFGSQISLRSHDSKIINARESKFITSHRKALPVDEEDDDDDVVISLSPKHATPSLNSSSRGIPLPRPRVSSVDKRGNGRTTPTDDSPKPAPRQVNRQETNKPAISSLNLKLSTPKRLSEWKEIKRRGMFYLEDKGEVMSTQYSLVIAKPTSVWISIIPAPLQSTAEISPPFAMSLLVIRSKADKNGHSLVTLTEKRDNTGKYGVKCDLEAGKYYLLAFTSGCSLPLTKPSTEAQKKLVKKKTGGGSDQYVLTKDFKYVLTDIFNMVDTDMNGLLSREEFNQYSVRTGEDEIGDDEWNIVKDNAELKKGELTCKGFIQLIELEADDAGGDTEDLWVTLEALGYDSSLTQNQAFPFTLEVYMEVDGEHTLSPLPVLLSSKSKSLQTALKEAYTSKGELLSSECRCRAAKSSGNERDVSIYMFETETMAAIAIDNKLPTRATVKLDCSSSKNVKSNCKSLSEVFTVPATTYMVAYHLVPSDESKDWSVSCVERDLVIT